MRAIMVGPLNSTTSISAGAQTVCVMGKPCKHKSRAGESFGRGCDYRYRRVIPRNDISVALAEHIRHIDYDNVKEATGDAELHTAYANVWWIMHQLQSPPWRR
jgi:hypothetical protein